MTTPFTQQEQGEPIAAIATPVGIGALAVVRISGRGVFDIAHKVFKKKGESRISLRAIERLQGTFRHRTRPRGVN